MRLFLFRRPRACPPRGRRRGTHPGRIGGGERPAHDDYWASASGEATDSRASTVRRCACLWCIDARRAVQSRGRRVTLGHGRPSGRPSPDPRHVLERAIDARPSARNTAPRRRPGRRLPVVHVPDAEDQAAPIRARCASVSATPSTCVGVRGGSAHTRPAATSCTRPIWNMVSRRCKRTTGAGAHRAEHPRLAGERRRRRCMDCGGLGGLDGRAVRTDTPAMAWICARTSSGVARHGRALNDSNAARRPCTSPGVGARAASPTRPHGMAIAASEVRDSLAASRRALRGSTVGRTRQIG